MDVLSIGTLGIDEIIVKEKTSGCMLGGSLAYISIGVGKFKIENHIIGIVGNDFSQRNMEILKDNNVNLEYLETDKNKKSFYWCAKYSDNMETRETLTTNVNVMENYIPNMDELSKEKIKILVLGSVDPDLQLHLLKKLRIKPTFIITDTIEFWIKSKKSKVLEVIKNSDLICLSLEEVTQLIKDDNINDIKMSCTELSKIGPKYIIVKDGSNGSYLYSSVDDDINYVKTLKLNNVIDTTGAGDTYIAGITSYLNDVEIITKNDILEAMNYGTALATICIEGIGISSLLLVTTEQIYKRIENLRGCEIDEKKSINKCV